nr:hypothetical protein CFP56_09573 [Quercus suber]
MISQPFVPTGKESCRNGRTLFKGVLRRLQRCLTDEAVCYGGCFGRSSHSKFTVVKMSRDLGDNLHGLFQEMVSRKISGCAGYAMVNHFNPAYLCQAAPHQTSSLAADSTMLSRSPRI